MTKSLSCEASIDSRWSRVRLILAMWAPPPSVWPMTLSARPTPTTHLSRCKLYLPVSYISFQAMSVGVGYPSTCAVIKVLHRLIFPSEAGIKRCSLSLVAAGFATSVTCSDLPRLYSAMIALADSCLEGVSFAQLLPTLRDTYAAEDQSRKNKKDQDDDGVRNDAISRSRSGNNHDCLRE